MPAIDPSNPEAISYHALISQTLSNNIDNRVSGIEIQFEGPLKIDGNVEALILPSTLLDSPALKEAINKKGIAAIPYRQIDRQRPSEYVTKIFETCYEYYERIGLINLGEP